MIHLIVTVKMEIQDIDDAEKSAGSDIISRTETSCTWDVKPTKPADIESGVTNNSMVLFLKHDCSELDHVLTKCKNWRAAACNVWFHISQIAGLLLAVTVNRSRSARVSRCNHRERRFVQSLIDLPPCQCKISTSATPIWPRSRTAPSASHCIDDLAIYNLGSSSRSRTYCVC